ncbi:MAG: response regulator, partial [Acidobacteriota bacterium]
LPEGTETVLVVEDEPGVRSLAVGFLEHQGYSVLEARHGRHGLEVYERERERIDLVLTDVVMPEMNGPEMIRTLQQTEPDLRFLYMSGYTDQVLGTETADFSALLVQKPFSIEELVLKVREVIDG